MIIFEITDINLVSSNRRIIPCKGRFCNNPKYQDSKRYIADFLKLSYKFDKPIDIKNKMIILEFYIDNRKDSDNCIKIVFDALQEAGVIKNDKDITRYLVIKCKKKIHEKVIIKIV